MSAPTVAGLEKAIVLLDEASEKSLTDWRDLSAGEMAETLWRIAGFDGLGRTPIEIRRVSAADALIARYFEDRDDRDLEQARIELRAASRSDTAQPLVS